VIIIHTVNGLVLVPVSVHLLQRACGHVSRHSQGREGKYAPVHLQKHLTNPVGFQAKGEVKKAPIFLILVHILLRIPRQTLPPMQILNPSISCHWRCDICLQETVVLELHSFTAMASFTVILNH
jgi:hypothetical protein